MKVTARPTMTLGRVDQDQPDKIGEMRHEISSKVKVVQLIVLHGNVEKGVTAMTIVSAKGSVVDCEIRTKSLVSNRRLGKNDRTNLALTNDQEAAHSSKRKLMTHLAPQRKTHPQTSHVLQELLAIQTQRRTTPALNNQPERQTGPQRQLTGLSSLPTRLIANNRPLLQNTKCQRVVEGAEAVAGVVAGVEVAPALRCEA